MRVEELCTHEVIEIAPSASLVDVAALMRRSNVGTLVVCSARGGRVPIGLLSDPDIVVSALALGLEPDTLTVGDIMTRPAVTLPASATVFEAIVAMRTHGLRRLPLLDSQGQLAGLVSADDLLGALAHLLQSLSDAMTREMMLEMKRHACAG